MNENSCMDQEKIISQLRKELQEWKNYANALYDAGWELRHNGNFHYRALPLWREAVPMRPDKDPRMMHV